MATTRETLQPMTAIERWRSMVAEEHAQSQRARGATPPPGDHWSAVASSFRADPHRTDDPLLERLLRFVAPHHTALDVGAGAGRYALPMALRCQHVTAVEPSPAMAGVLHNEIGQVGVSNVSVVQAEWEEAQVAAADLVLCVNVLYTVPEIESFIRKLETHARERVLVVLHVDAPSQAQVFPFWRSVYGEERLRLPGLRDLMRLLWEMEVYPDLEMLPSRHRSFESQEAVSTQLRDRLYLTPGDPKEALLDQALTELLEETDGGFQVRGAAPMRPGLLSWHPNLPLAQR